MKNKSDIAFVSIDFKEITMHFKHSPNWQNNHSTKF